MHASSAAFQAVLSPLEDTDRAEAVVRRIGEAIALGLLNDGDQLPPENELAPRLGVAIGTVREALVSLREHGLVETRRGRGGGSFVRASDEELSALQLQRLKAISTTELRDIGDEKLAVSGTAARLAAERADPEIGPRLKSMVAALRDATTFAQARRTESRFHIEIAIASQSVRLSHAEARIQAKLNPLVWLPEHAPRVDDVAHRLDDLVVALTAGDGAQARTITENHVLSCVRCAVAAHLRTVID